MKNSLGVTAAEIAALQILPAWCAQCTSLDAILLHHRCRASAYVSVLKADDLADS